MWAKSICNFDMNILKAQRRETTVFCFSSRDFTSSFIVLFKGGRRPMQRQLHGRDRDHWIKVRNIIFSMNKINLRIFWMYHKFLHPELLYFPHHRLGFLSTGDVEIKGGMKVIHKKVSVLCINYKPSCFIQNTLSGSICFKYDGVCSKGEHPDHWYQSGAENDNGSDYKCLLHIVNA